MFSDLGHGLCVAQDFERFDDTFQPFAAQKIGDGFIMPRNGNCLPRFLEPPDEAGQLGLGRRQIQRISHNKIRSLSSPESQAP